jgi:hypothetical protein
METTIPRIPRRRRFGAVTLGAAVALLALLAVPAAVFANSGLVSASVSCTGWSATVVLHNNVQDRLVIVGSNIPAFPGQTFQDETTTSASGDTTIWSANGSGPLSATYTVTLTIYNGNTPTSDIENGPNNGNSRADYTKTFGPATGCTQTPSISTSLSGGGRSGASITVPIGTTVTDTATVSAVVPATPTAPVPTGTVTFTVYTSYDCSTGAQSAGSPTLSGGQATSTGIQFNHAGTYYWQAVYNPAPGSNFNSVTSGCTEELVTVVKATPSIDTAQQPASATVGTSIADKATVTGGYNPGGTVTFNLYDNPSGTGTPLFTDTETLVGGVATSAGYTATATGTDYWVATYNGDDNNVSVTSGTSDEPVSITPADPSINTTQQPASARVGSSVADKATVSGGYNPTGTVTFNLYNNSAGTGTPLFTDANVALVSGVATSAGYTATSTGTYYWVATYNGDSNNNPVTSGAASEPVSITRTLTCGELGTCPQIPSPSPSPSVSPSPSPSVSPSVSPSPTATGGVAGATSKPRITPPPTSSLGGTTGGPSSGIWLVLLALAGLLGSILLLTPAPARARRKR